MNISAAAAKSGVPAKTIRYYESIGLVQPATRAENGYRVYDEHDVQTLWFIRRARHLGFTVEEVSNLLTLWRDRGRTSVEVKALALKRIGDIDRKLRELDSLKRVLRDLANRCRGDDRPDCPIIDNLAGSDSSSGAIRQRHRSHARSDERPTRLGHA